MPFVCAAMAALSVQIFICKGRKAEYTYSRSFRETAVIFRWTRQGKG
jgi:hypothetical protein